MNPFIVLCICLAITLISCDKDDRVVKGMKPIYISIEAAQNVASRDSQEFGFLGKIVAYNDFIFINERHKGIHVIDNTDPANPVKIHFWSIPGNLEFTVTADVLYADNSIDLLVIDITDFANIKLISVIDDQYLNDIKDYFPNVPKTWFECYDRSKGILVDWQEATLTNPMCETL